MRTPDGWLKYFIWPIFFVDLRCFGDFLYENKKKDLLFKAGWHPNAGWLPKGAPQFWRFQFILYEKPPKNI